ncbi:NAD(+)/NADH kinase [Halorientalis salina]|uniref:NAD(+)/NADH kinase n=1 Tax=Halorientalis salina TaxID=2932266 RepID=UPI0010AD72E0|nr:NAD(+)/NADH kinase [Halorientalis salina]
MSEPAEPSVVGVVGERIEPVRSAIETAGVEHRTGALSTVLSSSPDVLVTVGEGSLLDLTARETVPDVPVLPVNAGTGVQSVPLSGIDGAIEALLDGAGGTHSRPVLAAMADGIERGRALCDLMLVTADPARISEYSVRTDGDLVAQFRADGVVVATPLGSHGYARSNGAPIVARDTGVVSVVPIAPFAIDADHWILPADGLTLTVERDDAPVELLADDRRGDCVPPDTPLSVAQIDRLTVRTLPQSTAPFGGPDESASAPE